MGMVIRFPVRGHDRTSTGSIPNKCGGARFPSRRNASSKIMNFSEGMRPLARQLLTAGRLTPASAAEADVPPQASNTSSTVAIMTPEYSRSVNKSIVHTMAIVTSCEFRLNPGMARTIKDVAARLAMTQVAMEISSADLCRETGVKPNQWSQFLNPDKKRRITLAAAYKLKDKYGITLEWIYDGDPSKLPHEIRVKLRRAA